MEDMDLDAYDLQSFFQIYHTALAPDDVVQHMAEVVDDLSNADHEYDRA